MIKNKKGDLPLQYIFLIFIATIAVFVVVGMITNWSLSANKYIGNLYGGDDKPMEDIQVVHVTCTQMENEIIKHAKICHKKGTDGMIRGNLCFALVAPNTCSVSASTITSALGTRLKTPFTTSSNKFVIAYDTVAAKVEIL